MVAVLLRLRFRVLATTLARSPLQLVAVILGAIQAVPILLACGAGVIALSGFPPDIVRTTMITAGSLVVVGWLVIPIIVSGVELTLDPHKLAYFPLRPRTLMLAQLLVGLTWVPGGVTLLLALFSAFAYRGSPDVIPVAITAGAVGTLLAVAGSRMAATVTGNLLSDRGVHVRVAVIAALAVVVLGPVVVAIAVGLGGQGGLDAAAQVMSWSPVGAVWAVPGDLALGRPGEALASAGIAVAGVVAVLAVWRIALGASLGHRGTGALRASQAGRLGAFRIGPSSPAGAVAARSLHYWFHDPRYARQLVIVPMMPALMLLWAAVTGVEGIGIAAGPAVAGLLPLAVFAGISFDGTAFAAHLTAGVRGRDDRVGRLAAMLVIAVPATLAVQLAVTAVLNRWEDLPALVGMSIGVLLTALGVVAVSSALLVIPVPRPGRNPFSGAAGAGMTSIGGSYAVTGATLVLASPALVLGILSVVLRSAAVGWVALGAGGVLGLAVLLIGIRIGGALLDRRGPELLTRLRALRG
ncbi:MAG: transporter [Micrococcales bacterium]|nr:transporter [Micrococcales bacterium]